MSAPINWEELSDLEQLDILSRPDSEHRFMAFINVAYCDESEQHRPPGVFLVSGYLGRGPDWFELGRKWRAALKGKPFEAKGFHMSHCEAGKEPPYDTMSRQERDDHQHTFISIINDTPLWAYAIAVETAPYLAMDQDPAVKARRGDYAGKPYYLGFHHTIQRMALVLEQGHFPYSECITFVFDQQKEYEGKALALYNDAKQAPLDFVHRLGAIQFDERTSSVQLQASDIWAYESMRHFRDVKLLGLRERPQFDLLRSVRTPAQMELGFFDHTALQRLGKRVGWLL
jgi:hypothetical protein